ncbi:hypothetical protein ACFV14_36545 [Streptomyces zaomyceticus]|uniref:hypothetical protein n=1 Tax=Streptomyces zaomyceticus TaxID=68286 RepID=UPI00367FAC58
MEPKSPAGAAPPVAPKSLFAAAIPPVTGPPSPWKTQAAGSGSETSGATASEAAEASDAPRPRPDDEAPAREESGDEAVHTLLRTAATERPVEEVAALVARLQETGELASPADVALRAAAVTRPLDEVRQLLALLNASGYDLHEAETTLRAAAVGRPIEDVVRLVGILGADSADSADSGDRRSTAGAGAGAKPDAAPGKQGPARVGRAGGAGAPAVSAATAPRKRDRGAAKGRKSVLDGALAAGPSHVATPALRSVLRWPAALALFVCGLIHLPTDLAGLRSGGDAQALSAVVTVLCLACAVWLAARDTLIAWAAGAGAAVFVIAVHGVAGARTVELLSDSLGTTFAWAKALALLSAVGIVCLSASALVRHAKASGATDGA